MNDTGVALVDGVATAGHCISHLSALDGALTANHIVLTAASAHDVPLRARAVIVQVPVIIGPGCPRGYRGEDEGDEEDPASIPTDSLTVIVGVSSFPGH